MASDHDSKCGSCGAQLLASSQVPRMQTQYQGQPQQVAVPQYQQTTVTYPQYQTAQIQTKFCKFCGNTIPVDSVLCTFCGRQVEELRQESPQMGNIVINNTNTNTNTASAKATAISGGIRGGRPKNKWVALALCILGGYFGLHKFYEGRIGSGLLYLCTLGLFGIGWIGDTIALLAKPNPYYV